MNYDDYSPTPPPPSRYSLGALTVILISIITSCVVTIAVLWGTDNLSLSIDGMIKGQDARNMQQLPLVPLVVGMSTESAKDLLRSRKLRMIVRAEKPDTSEKGVIIEQNPLPDSELQTGGAVSVIVSAGLKQVTIPEVVGKPLDEAKKLIKAAKIEVGEISESGTGEPGNVTRVMPMSGTVVDEGTKIALVIAQPGVEVPELLGNRTGMARKKLKKLGLKVGNIRWRYNEHKPANLVLGQDPSAGTRVAPNSAVNLVINEE